MFRFQSPKKEWLTGIWDRWRSEKSPDTGFGISPSCIIGTRSWLKMALPYPSSAPLLSSVRWRLRSSCYCSNAWLIYHPWPERGATERGLIASSALCSQWKSISSVQLERKSHIHVLDFKVSSFCFGWFDLVKLIYCQSHTVFTGPTLQHVKARTTDGFQFSFLFLSVFTIQLENVTGTIETVHFFFSFCQTHFPQIIPFMVGWLRTLHCRFPYLT